MESGIIDDGLPFKSLDSVCFDYQDRRTFARQSSIFLRQRTPTESSDLRGGGNFGDDVHGGGDFHYEVTLMNMNPNPATNQSG